jgi:hypothetical protein
MAISDNERKESPPRGYQADGGLVPVPDPTLLTTALVDKAITGLRTELNVRFEAIDAATRIVKEDYVRVPTVVDRAILTIRELMESRIDKLHEVFGERFDNISNQFIERDKRTDQLTLAAQTAVSAAFAAQKEAVAEQNKSNSAAINKSENATVESIRQLQNLFQSSVNSLNDKIADVKSRLDRGEGIDKGSGDRTAIMISIASVIISSLIGIAAIVTLSTKLLH